MRELTSLADVIDAGRNDPIIVWAAQGMSRGVRAWTDGHAVAVASPELSRRDRLAVRGDPPSASRLVRHALAEVGPTYRPFGDAELIATLAAAVEDLIIAGEFGWMDTTSTPPAVPGSTEVRWLPSTAETGAEIQALLDVAAPTSYAQPGLPGVRRWAGLRSAPHPGTPGIGRLIAVAADAWSTPPPAPDAPDTPEAPEAPDAPVGVGLVAGVATAHEARGHGYGTAVCAVALAALVSEHGRAALMVDSWNTAAVRMYKNLGLTWRSVAAAEITHGTHAADEARSVASMVAAQSTSSPPGSLR